MGPWRTVSVALKADASGMVAGTAAGSAAVKKFGDDSDRVLRQHDASVQRTGGGWRTVAKGIAGGLAIVGIALGLSLHEAIAWESAFAGVAKTVDGTASQLSDLEDGLLSMANRLPATRTEIAGVAEAAGALGIQRQSILGFTEVMIGLGEATNLTADEAATMLAQFANIMGTSQDDFESLADTLVNLGNNGASTEKEILDLALRLAGAGATIGLTEKQVFALANAMASMGIDAELGGGALSRVMRKIEVAVADGGERLSGFAEASGMSAEQFAQAWSEDPAAALQTFLESMKDVQDAGGNMYGVLADLGIKGSQDVDVIGRLISGSDGLAQSFRDADDAAGSLAEEVDKRYATAESQIRVFMNRVTDVARIVGAALIPALLAGLQAAERFGRWLGTIGVEASERLSGAWDDLESAGTSIVELLGDLWTAAGPAVTALAQLGGGVAIATLTAFASLLEETAGFLVDHQELVVAVGTAYLGWKAVGIIQNVTTALALMEVSGRKALQVFATTELAGNLRAIGGGALEITRNLATVPDASERMTSGMRSGLDRVRTGFDGVASGIGGVNGGLFGLAIGAGLAFRAIEQGAARARRWAADFVDELRIDPNDSQSVVGGLQEIQAQMEELQSQAEDRWDPLRGALLPKNTLDQINPFNDNPIQDARDKLAALGDESERISIEFIKNRRTVVEFAADADLSYSTVADVAKRSGIDIATAFDKTGKPSKELQDALDRNAQAAEDWGITTTEAAQKDVAALELIEEQVKRITEAGEATAGAWADLSNVMGLTDDPVDGDAVARSEQMVADARERVREAEKEAQAGGQSADEAQRTADALADARDALVDATEGHSDLLATDSPLNAAKVQQFYADRLAEAETFAANLNTAIEAGYNPNLLSRLMQAGPEAAGPVLAALVEDTSTAYVESINRAEEALGEFSAFAVRQAQLTQRAIEVGTRQAAEDLATAIAIEQQSMLDPTLTGADIAERLGITLADAQRVIDTFGLEVNVVTEPAERELRDFTEQQRPLNIDVEAITERAEEEIRLTARDRTAWITIKTTVEGIASLGPSASPGAINAERMNRWGGVYEFARGGVTPAHVAFGTRYKWAEPATGGEAFIPRYGNRWRSVGILGQAASWYGMSLAPKGANQVPPAPARVPYGGAMAPSGGSTPAPAQRGDVNVTFNRMTSDERTLTREAQQRLGVYG